jgi:hypothetical protein
MCATTIVEATTELGAIRVLRQVGDFTAWVGDGRALTQAGRLKLADARELRALLGTDDWFDPADPAMRLSSSDDLPELSLVVAWAKACGFVRVARGRIVPVKKHARLLGDDARLWDRMFECFPRLGPVLCPDGWTQSFLRDEFATTLEAVLLRTYRNDAAITISDACALAWEIATARYLLDGAPELHRETWRTTCDRDMGYALTTLEQLGAMRRDGDTLTLTEPALMALRRATGDAVPGDAILQLKVTLPGLSGPPVWRRVLVPARIRLDRLHDVLQATMGWTDSHLHAFTAAGVDYGPPIEDLDHRDERRATLNRLLKQPGDRMGYTYDYGDYWEHEVVVEKVLAAQPGVRYPLCTGGARRCPPEDCGGTWGYADLLETLADPRADDHADMLDWLGLETAAQFDPAEFDIAVVNRLL